MYISKKNIDVKKTNSLILCAHTKLANIVIDCIIRYDNFISLSYCQELDYQKALVNSFVLYT